MVLTKEYTTSPALLNTLHPTKEVKFVPCSKKVSHQLKSLKNSAVIAVLFTAKSSVVQRLNFAQI
ncbi:hypothetical protein LZ11_02347 [Thermosediminibacter litoriperuensis]|uniref:Uncharacterized protein n=1 Tax=Thermosediminibacter litoriperuensis TaxID=291989 RepID=A0A5S5AFT2_9FIRM|nr:hypothetical protein LZ11_02347 [Thermosediminibacter litoriperuensis]